MSKTENASEVKAETIKRTISGFDENLNDVSKEIEISFTPAISYEEGVSRLNNDTNLILKGMNQILKSEAVKAEKAKAGISSAFNREFVMEFIKPWRMNPPFSSMVTATDKRKATAEEWHAQTKAILEQIKAIPELMVQLRGGSAAANATDDAE